MKGECKRRISGNRVLIANYCALEVTGSWRIFHSEVLYNLHGSSKRMRVIELKGSGVVNVGETRNSKFS